MPVTKTAKRALRSSQRKNRVNNLMLSKLEAAVRMAKKLKTLASITLAVSLADRAAKKKFIHKNKASRLKASLSKILVKKKTPKK